MVDHYFARDDGQPDNQMIGTRILPDEDAAQAWAFEEARKRGLDEISVSRGGDPTGDVVLKVPPA